MLNRAQDPESVVAAVEEPTQIILHAWVAGNSTVWDETPDFTDLPRLMTYRIAPNVYCRPFRPDSSSSETRLHLFTVVADAPIDDGWFPHANLYVRDAMLGFLDDERAYAGGGGCARRRPSAQANDLLHQEIHQLIAATRSASRLPVAHRISETWYLLDDDGAAVK